MTWARAPMSTVVQLLHQMVCLVIAGYSYLRKNVKISSMLKPHLGTIYLVLLRISLGFPGGSAVKNPPANAGDTSSIPGSGRSPGEENGNPFQYSCLRNPMDRGAWQAIVHGAAKSETQPSIHTVLVTKYNFSFLNKFFKKFSFASLELKDPFNYY